MTAYHTCRYSNSGYCLACDTERAQRHAQDALIAEGRQFIQAVLFSPAKILKGDAPEGGIAAVGAGTMHLVGMAIAEGRRQAQALGDGPVGLPGSAIARFDALEIGELEIGELS